MSQLKYFGFVFFAALFIGLFYQSETQALFLRNPTISTSGGNNSFLISPVCGCSYCNTTSKFGPRWGRMHTGEDIDCRMGDIIRATSSGVVSFRGSRDGYGRQVRIRRTQLLHLAGGQGAFSPDQNIETSYSHLSEYLVSPGQRVNAGDPIGRCGNSGRSVSRGGDGTHLHYEVRVNGAAQNPRNFYNGSIQSACPSTRPKNNIINSNAPGVDV